MPGAGVGAALQLGLPRRIVPVHIHIGLRMGGRRVGHRGWAVHHLHRNSCGHWSLGVGDSVLNRKERRCVVRNLCSRLRILPHAQVAGLRWLEALKLAMEDVLMDVICQHPSTGGSHGATKPPSPTKSLPVVDPSS